MREHPAYSSAKSGTSASAALTLVSDLIADQAIDQIGNELGDRRLRIAAVHAQEAMGKNKIPMAYAEVLAEILNLDTDSGIVQATIANHGGAKSIYHRMVSQPAFDGYVEPNAEYLIVDDICTAGGTLANLKGFIEISGGRVVCMSVLARPQARKPYYISLADTTLARLKYRHPRLDEFWREEFGYGIEALTEGEAGHLLAAPSADTIRNRLAEARRDLNLNGDERPHSGAETASNESGDSARGPKDKKGR